MREHRSFDAYAFFSIHDQRVAHTHTYIHTYIHTRAPIWSWQEALNAFNSMMQENIEPDSLAYCSLSKTIRMYVCIYIYMSLYH